MNSIRRLMKRVKNAVFSRIHRMKFAKFYGIKEEACGMLAPAVYARIHETARRAGGQMIEIGAGQGAGTISIGLGMAASGKPSHLFSFEKCERSGALKTWDGKEQNVEVLETNLGRFGLKKSVTVIPENVHTTFERVLPHAPFSLICIDSDGAVDRVLEHFYNALLPGASVIIDDYENRIRVPKNIREQRGIPGYLREKNAETLKDLCPLGKHYSTWRLVNYFLESGLLEAEGLIRNTLFARKPGAIRDEVVWDIRRISEIRDEILNRYYKMTNPMASAPR